MGLSRRRPAGSRRAGVRRWSERALDRFQAVELLLDLRPQPLGGVGHLAPLAHELTELVVQPVALGLHLVGLRLEHRYAIGERPRATHAERPPDAVPEGAAHEQAEHDEGCRATAHREILQSAGGTGP